MMQEEFQIIDSLIIQSIKSRGIGDTVDVILALLLKHMKKLDFSPNDEFFRKLQRKRAEVD
jgi:hypothetical protein